MQSSTLQYNSPLTLIMYQARSKPISEQSILTFKFLVCCHLCYDTMNVFIITIRKQQYVIIIQDGGHRKLEVKIKNSKFSTGYIYFLVVMIVKFDWLGMLSSAKVISLQLRIQHLTKKVNITDAGNGGCKVQAAGCRSLFNHT